MRRRRGPKSTWFPVLGTDSGETNPLTSVYTVVQEVALNYGTSKIITPIIPDGTSDPSNPTSNDGSLRDYVEGQTCIIDRIVGKIFCTAAQLNQSPDTSPTAICACAAIAVLPVDDSGTALTDADGIEQDPLAAENLDKPWLWRRTWMLGNLEGYPQGSVPYPFPTNNAAYGSVMDGPHIDTKGVKRAIQRNQRLFLILATQDQSPGEPNQQGEVFWAVDLRVLGRMRKARNRSVFT